VLRGDEAVWLRPATPRRSARPTPRGKAAEAVGRPASGGFATAADEALWSALRERRQSLARERGVPPYVVFHDATLVEMVRRRPTELAAFALLPGVGERKLAAYGEAFLAVLRAPPA
jgi:ATP-dependent DNA helicase RecQ